MRSFPPSPPLEFSRRFFVDRAAHAAIDESIEANEQERALLAERFSLPAIETLCATFTVRPMGKKKIELTGRITAHFHYTCVRSLVSFPATHEGDVLRIFWRTPPTAKEAVLLDSDEAAEEDVLLSDHLDLGEIAAEEFALALDPYPKSPTTRASPEDAPSENKRIFPFADLQERISQNRKQKNKKEA